MSKEGRDRIQKQLDELWDEIGKNPGGRPTKEQVKKVKELQSDFDDECDYVRPDPEKSNCKGCEWRAPDCISKNGAITYGSTIGKCDIYGILKPSGIIWGREECPYYLKEQTKKEPEYI